MTPSFLFVSAENDALANCKAGGLADVVRDVPVQIANNSHLVSTIVPSYGRLHKNGVFIGHFSFPFRGEPYTVEFYKVNPKAGATPVNHFVVHHQEFTEGNIAQIYQHDQDEPFFTDANKFALFCAAVANLVLDGVFGHLDVVHLHDWHTALVLYLREFHPAYAKLKNIRFVFSIHNLSIQGIRPIDGNHSSLRAWYPELQVASELVADPRYPDCINLMGVGIRYADAVHTVSPSYKEDILLPSESPHFIGGEGLEKYLQEADQGKRLFGILNGVDYKQSKLDGDAMFFEKSLNAIYGWLGEEEEKYKSDFLIHTGYKLSGYLLKKPSFMMASIARLTEQKFYFFKQFSDIFGQLMQELKKVNGIYVILGTGDPDYETFFREASCTHTNFVFINGQSEAVVNSIYKSTNLYLMPSLFEPCGICQMLAMRYGNPCLAHNTGGLKDTVGHGVNGFTFDGKTNYQKSLNLLQTFKEALALFFGNREEWEEIRTNALSSHFSWESSVNDYYRNLYNIPLACSFEPSRHKLKKKHNREKLLNFNNQ